MVCCGERGRGRASDCGAASCGSGGGPDAWYAGCSTPAQRGGPGAHSDDAAQRCKSNARAPCDDGAPHTHTRTHDSHTHTHTHHTRTTNCMRTVQDPGKNHANPHHTDITMQNPATTRQTQCTNTPTNTQGPRAQQQGERAQHSRICGGVVEGPQQKGCLSPHARSSWLVSSG